MVLVIGAVVLVVGAAIDLIRSAGRGGTSWGCVIFGICYLLSRFFL